MYPLMEKGEASLSFNCGAFPTLKICDSVVFVLFSGGRKMKEAFLIYRENTAQLVRYKNIKTFFGRRRK